jgi:hypothetical protein
MYQIFLFVLTKKKKTKKMNIPIIPLIRTEL